MELTGSYRHELKYQISPADHHALRQRLRAVMKRDPHTRADGLYTIRSVYFDNYGGQGAARKGQRSAETRKIPHPLLQR